MLHLHVASYTDLYNCNFMYTNCCMDKRASDISNDKCDAVLKRQMDESAGGLFTEFVKNLTGL